MSTAFQEAAPHDRVVGLVSFELEPCLAEAERHTYRLPIVEKINLGFGVGETQQVEHRLFLVLRPQALALDVRPARCQDVDADDGEPDKHCDDNQKRRNDEQHALATAEPLRNLRERNHESRRHGPTLAGLRESAREPRLAIVDRSPQWRFSYRN